MIGRSDNRVIRRTATFIRSLERGIWRVGEQKNNQFIHPICRSPDHPIFQGLATESFSPGNKGAVY